MSFEGNLNCHSRQWPQVRGSVYYPRTSLSMPVICLAAIMMIALGLVQVAAGVCYLSGLNVYVTVYYYLVQVL